MGEVPTDRQVVSGWQDPSRPNVKMASHYFLSDFAHKILNLGYDLVPVSGMRWQLHIKDRNQAAVFKLVFM